MAEQQKPPSPSPAAQASDAAVSARKRALAELRALGYGQVPKAAPIMRGRAVTAAQAALGTGVLGQLWRQAQSAQACLAELRSVLPASLLGQVQPGPIEDGVWTLLVGHSSAAAKIRQWVPALQAHVRTKGWPVQRIEVKMHRT